MGRAIERTADPEERIAWYMSPNPHTIGSEQTLAIAHDLLRRYRIRHLPVLDGGRLVGVVTDRDLHLVETLKGADPEKVAVFDAMSPDPFTVSPDDPLERVAQTMASQKYGSAIVVQNGRVVGVFTAVDALRAVVSLLEKERASQARREP